MKTTSKKLSVCIEIKGSGTKGWSVVERRNLISSHRSWLQTVVHMIPYPGDLMTATEIAEHVEDFWRELGAEIETGEG